MAAVRVSLSWFGTRKTLTAEQRAEAAEPFCTDVRFLSAGKRLLDISHPAYKAVTAVRNRVISFWKSMSLPYPEPGIRLRGLDGIEAHLTAFRQRPRQQPKQLSPTQQQVEWLMGKFTTGTIDAVCEELFGGEG
jgi:hypothetical protein